eukprot:941039-Amphidinium_carterae.1
MTWLKAKTFTFQPRPSSHWLRLVLSKRSTCSVWVGQWWALGDSTLYVCGLFGIFVSRILELLYRDEPIACHDNRLRYACLRRVVPVFMMSADKWSFRPQRCPLLWLRGVVGKSRVKCEQVVNRSIVPIENPAETFRSMPGLR